MDKKLRSSKFFDSSRGTAAHGKSILDTRHPFNFLNIPILWFVFAGCSFVSEISLSNENTTSNDQDTQAVRTCTTYSDIFRAFAEKAPFTGEFESIVVYVSAKTHLIRIQNDIGIVLPCDLPEEFKTSGLSLKLGSRIRLACKWNPRMDHMQATSLTMIGQATPIVGKLYWRDGIPSSSNKSYIKATGVVQEICLKAQYTYFIIKTDDGHLKVRLLELANQPNYEAYLGRRVNVHGAFSKNFLDAETVSGFRIDLMENSQIQLVDSDESMISGSEKNTIPIHGFIDALDPKRAIYVNGIRIATHNDFVLEIDHTIDGYFIRTDLNYEPFVYLKLGKFQNRPIPKPIDASLVRNMQLYSRVTVEGIIQGWNRVTYRSECVVDSGGTQFRVLIANQQNHELESAIYKLSPGSLVRFTGIINKPNTSRFANEQFMLRVSSPNHMVFLNDAANVTRSRLKRWVNISAALLVAALVWALILRRQISARTQTIQHMASLLRSASESIPDGMMIFSGDGKLMATNENVKKTLEIMPSPQSREAIVAKLLREQVSEPDEFGAFWKSAFNDQKQIARREFFKANGLQSWSFYTAPISDDRGNFIGRIWTISETTLIRRIEAERAHSQKIQAIGRLAGGIAHDFNNHLAAISANLSLAIAPNLQNDATKRKHLEVVQAVVQKASKLTKQLLGFSRQSTLDISAVSICKVLEEVRMLMEHAVNSSIHFTIRCAEDLYHCRADAMQLEQVFFNLCLNARDALPEDGGSISVNAQNVTDPVLGDCVCVSVSDNGCGISDEVKQTIFDPFFTTKPVGSGTGLGLSLALGVISQLGGKIECQSKLGCGTRFDVFLPKDTNGKSVPAIAFDDATKLPKETQPLKVLLVDDDPILRDCGSVLLSTLGHQVWCADNGKEALRILACDSTIHTVLLDLTMPVMSGTETLRVIRKDFPNVRVVICSGYSADAASLTRDSQLQPDAILEKPYRVSDLQRVLS